MEEVLIEADKLIEKFRNTDFVQQMMINKIKINNDNLINTPDIKELYKNEIIHSYIKNQNILDYHIYYLNKEINKLIDNKICKENI